MTSSGTRRHGLTALTGVFLLLSGLSSAAFAQDLRGLQTADVRQDGEATVQEDTISRPNIGTVIAKKIAEGFVTLAPIRFTQSAGNKVFVSWVFPDSPIDVGIIVDDGVPF